MTLSYIAKWKLVHRKRRPKPPPPPPPPVPDDSWTKAAILGWLDGQGVDIGDPALSRLTKAELLDLVDDVLSP